MAIRLNVSIHADLQWLLDSLGLQLRREHFTPHYNVRPLSAVWGVTRSNQGAQLAPMQWGFIPPWAKDGQFRRPLTIARAETIYEKPSFRSLITRYRGFLPVNGFYEWRRGNAGRAAHYIKGPDRAMALATLFQMHGDGYQQCCVISTRSQSAMRAIHERQPVVIPLDRLDDWLFNDRPDAVRELLNAQTSLQLQALENYVDDPSNDGPECLTALPQDDNPHSS